MKSCGLNLVREFFIKTLILLLIMSGYLDLDLFLETMETKYSTGGKRLYYLAVAPEFLKG